MTNNNDHGLFQVDLQLPRLQMESSFTVRGMLMGIGMPLVFSHEPDFTGMVSEPADDHLFISDFFYRVRFFIAISG